MLQSKTDKSRICYADHNKKITAGKSWGIPAGEYKMNATAGKTLESVVVAFKVLYYRWLRAYFFIDSRW